MRTHTQTNAHTLIQFLHSSSPYFAKPQSFGFFHLGSQDLSGLYYYKQITVCGFFSFFLKGQNSSAATRGGASKTGAHLEWEAVSLTPKEPFSKPGWTSETPTAAWESSVGGEVLVTLGPPAASSCHDILSLTLKAPVEEAVLLCVAVKDVASMPLSAEAPWR